MTGTTFSLIRHGAYPLLDQAFGGGSDHPLSDEGRAQAERVGEALRPRAIAAVASSPVRRAMETAEIIAARLGVPLHAEPGFAEIDVGAWTGVRFDSLKGDPGWRAWNSFRGIASPPAGETMLKVQARAVEALLRWATRCPDREVAVISHADVIKAILSHMLGAPMDLLRRIEIGPASVSRVVVYGEDARVTAVNLPP